MQANEATELRDLELWKAVVRVKWTDADITYTDNFGDKYVYAGHKGLGGGKNPLEAWQAAAQKVLEAEYGVLLTGKGWQWSRHLGAHESDMFPTRLLALESAGRDYLSKAQKTAEEDRCTCGHNDKEHWNWYGACFQYGCQCSEFKRSPPPVSAEQLQSAPESEISAPAIAEVEIAEGAEQPEEQFYVATLSHDALWPRGVILWWAANRSGYSSFLEKAGKYSREEAQSIVSHRGGDFMVPCATADSKAVRVVDLDLFKELTGEVPL